jgi:hypothetical protein
MLNNQNGYNILRIEFLGLSVTMPMVSADFCSVTVQEEILLEGGKEEHQLRRPPKSIFSM